jgi:antitoxin component of MazEF toxin-antitoxin module
MVEVIVTARRWGNSIGATFPAEIVSKERIRPNDRLVVEVRKVVPIRELFGTAKFKKSAQEIKDEMRSGWD